MHRCLVCHGITRLPGREPDGAALLEEVVTTYPGTIHTALTDNGVTFTEQPQYRNGLTNRFGGHIFDSACQAHGVKHMLTKPDHPWTNGQAERMNRTVKEATIKSFLYPDFDAPKAHVLTFVTAYNFAKHLEALGGVLRSKRSVMPGLERRTVSGLTRTTSSRDYTPRQRTIGVQYHQR